MLGLLLATAIIAILAVLLLGGPEAFRGSGEEGGGRLGGMVKARQTAKDTVCRSNLVQLRHGLEMERSATGEYPASLEEVAQVYPGVQTDCPVGGEPYDYDAAAGEVKCIHPGHERY